MKLYYDLNFPFIFPFNYKWWQSKEMERHDRYFPEKLICSMKNLKWQKRKLNLQLFELNVLFLVLWFWPFCSLYLECCPSSLCFKLLDIARVSFSYGKISQLWLVRLILNKAPCITQIFIFCFINVFSERCYFCIK